MPHIPSRNGCLDPQAPTDALRSLWVTFASERVRAFPLGPWVSDPKHEGPRCLEPMGAELHCFGLAPLSGIDHSSGPTGETVIES